MLIYLSIFIENYYKVITDKFNLPDVGEDRSYMKTRTESLMKNETFFLLLDPKMKKSKKKKDQQQPQVNTSSNSVPKYSGSASNSVSSANAQRIDINLDNSNKNSSEQVQQFNVQESGRQEEGMFSCCKKCFSCFKSENEG